MDRPEYELVTNTKEKYENQDIFSMISPYFLRLQHHRIIYNKCGDEWRRRAVRSPTVVENGEIGFACTIVLFRESTEHGREAQHWHKWGDATFLTRWRASERRCGGCLGLTG